MVDFVRFSEFVAIHPSGNNSLVGLSDGVNAISEFPLNWTTATRPIAPTNGTLGYNTDTSTYEYWNANTSMWVQLENNTTGIINPAPINSIAWYASTGNTIDGLISLANSVLSFDPSGVPLISTILPTLLTIGSPKIDQILDSSGNITLFLNPASAAVNYISVFNQSTGFAPGFTASGSDTNIGFGLNAKGTGNFLLTSANTIPLSISSGTGLQHNTSFSFANTAASRIVTFQDADGTVAFTSQIPSLPISPANGGTGVANTGNLTWGAAVTFSGAFASTFTLTGVTTVTFPTSGTLATTSQIPTGSALTKTDDTNVTLTLGGSPTTALVNAASLTLGWTGTLSGTRGGTGVNNGASTITLGGSLTTAGAFASTFTMTGATNVTFPTSGTLATVGDSIISIQGTASQVLVNGTSGSPVTGTPITLTLPQNIATTSTPIFAGINDANNLPILALNTGATPANFFSIVNSAGNPQISVTGSSTNPGFNLATKGIGSFFFLSASTTPINILSGTGLQHSTGFAFANTAASRTVTFPDADGTVLFSSSPTINIQKFTTSGTYTPTSAMQYCIIECVGAGGAGGGAALSTGTGTGGGGGAGAYSRKFATAATIGASQTVTVATGGTPGTAGNNPGGNGSGATSVGAICTAGSGTGGGGVAANNAGVGGAGGIVGTGDLSVAGNAGAGGFAASIVTVSMQSGGGGAGTWGGQAAITGTGSQAGNGAGTGGNAGISTVSSAAKAGGAGANGIVIITEYIYG